VRTQLELETALWLLGWKLDGPKKTAGGWKATIERGDTSITTTGKTELEVLEDLLRSAEQRKEQP
jgi:hypothetical protein